MNKTKKILVVVDMQNDFIDGSLGSLEAQGIVDNVVNLINNFDGAVIATRDTHRDNYMESCEGKHLPVEHCIAGTTGWEINSKVKEALDNTFYLGTIDKPSFGSLQLINVIGNFIQSYNKDAMNGKGIEIVLCGVCTDICVVSNTLLLKAAFPEAEFYIPSDCCAGVTVDSHNAALETMNSCHINIYYNHINIPLNGSNNK